MTYYNLEQNEIILTKPLYIYSNMMFSTTSAAYVKLAEAYGT